jgi:hypothetical protein
MNVARPLGSAALLGALVALPACAVRAYPPAVGGYATVYADSVPDDIYAYPHVYYDGGYAYLVGDSWYYPNGGSWVTLRGEPPELYRYRVNYRSAYGPGYYGYAPQPGYRAVPRYNVAPPAYGYPPPAQRVR